MCRKTAEQVLIETIATIKETLNELYGKWNAAANADFVLGEKTAYVDVLEQLSRWEEAEEYGLDFAIQQKYAI